MIQYDIDWGVLGGGGSWGGALGRDLAVKTVVVNKDNT